MAWIIQLAIALARRDVVVLQRSRRRRGSAGAVRVAGTRIPVWQLVEARAIPGASDVQLLTDYPRLTAVNLADAWAYAEDHAREIAALIQQNQVA